MSTKWVSAVLITERPRTRHEEDCLGSGWGGARMHLQETGAHAKLITEALSRNREQWDGEDLLGCIRGVHCWCFPRFFGGTSPWPLHLKLWISAVLRLLQVLPHKALSLQSSLPTTSLSNVGVPFHPSWWTCWVRLQWLRACSLCYQSPHLVLEK